MLLLQFPVLKNAITPNLAALSPKRTIMAMPLVNTDSSRFQAILSFWFGQPTDPDYGRYRKAWFVKSSDFDAQIRQRFLNDYEKAAAGKYADWNTPRSAVALLLLLDQFPRHLFRGNPRSFATDQEAIALAKHLVNTSADKCLIPAERFFAYIPFEHSENLAHQERYVELIEGLIEETPNLDSGFKSGLDYAIRHRDTIKRFGRFPHRNQILGRQSTPAEIEFLKQPGSRF